MKDFSRQPATPLSHEGDIGSPYSRVTLAADRTCRKRFERVMLDPLSKADRYRKEAAKRYELAKNASPAFLSGFYRRIAVQCLFMAERELKLAAPPAPFA